MAILSHDDILALHAAALSSRLVDNRVTLLAGIPRPFVSALPHSSIPAGQILADLDALNQTGALADGAMPLTVWLSNAVALASGRPEVEIFRAALERCQSTGAMNLFDMKGHVDFGIVTIREDEFEAILDHFPKHGQVSGRRRYNLSRINTLAGNAYVIAVIRCSAQGNQEAEAATHDMLEDLDPQWVLLVGIAAGIPSKEFTLGDVIVSTRIHEFNAKSVLQEASTEYALAGGPVHKAVATVAANLPAMKNELRGWDSANSIGVARPPIDSVAQTSYYGDSEWRQRVSESLTHHAQRQVPIVLSGAIASSDALLRNVDMLDTMKKLSRQVMAVEMEAAGVYRAAHGFRVPMLSIRGISDLIGLRRDDQWTSYACNSAASFARAFIQTEPIEPRRQRSLTSTSASRGAIGRSKKSHDTASRGDSGFRPGPALIDDGRLPGREGVIQALLALIERRTPAMLIGPRRSGKTSVLGHLERRLAPTRDVRYVNLGSRTIRTLDDLIEALRIRSDDDKKSTKYSPKQILNSIDEKRALVFLLDEIAQLSRTSGEAFGWLRAAGQRGVALVLAGSPGDWTRLVEHAAGVSLGSPFGNDFMRVYIGPISEEDAMAFFLKKTTPAGEKFSETIARAIIAECGTWPYYLQIMGHAVAERMQRKQQLAADDIKDLYESHLLGNADHFFRGKWFELPGRVQRLLIKHKSFRPEFRKLSPEDRRAVTDAGLCDTFGNWVQDRPFFDWIRVNALQLQNSR